MTHSMNDVEGCPIPPRLAARIVYLLTLRDKDIRIAARLVNVDTDGLTFGEIHDAISDVCSESVDSGFFAENVFELICRAEAFNMAADVMRGKYDHWAENELKLRCME